MRVLTLVVATVLLAGMLIDQAPNGYDDELYLEIVELAPAN
jgi:hypothetical protein